MKKILISLALVCGVLQGGQSVSAQTPTTSQNGKNDTVQVRSSSQSEANCNTAVDRCAPPPQPKSCPTGSHWSLAGTGIAHCVGDTPVCAPGEVLQYDSLGNPSCVPKVVKPKKCANGASDYPTCTPPTGTCANGASDWPTCTPPTGTCANGASDWPACTPPVCIPSIGNPFDQGCPAGQTGTHYVRYDVTCPGSVSVLAYNDNQCVKPPASSCANGASDWPTCTPPTGTCANGASDWPTCTPPVVNKCANGASDWPSCTPVVNTCANGASDWPTCTPPTGTCANGASDWPTCTPVVNKCANGASDWPTCTPVTPVCANGASDWPTCTPPKLPEVSSCTAEIFYFNGVDKNNPTYTTIVVGVNKWSGGYCTGTTRNWATRYFCQPDGQMSSQNVIQNGCGLFN